MLQNDSSITASGLHATAHTYACKVASDEFDATCSRVEKQIEIARKKKNRALMESLEAKLDGLLEKGPTIPAPPVEEASSEEEMGDEEEEGEEEQDDM